MHRTISDFVLRILFFTGVVFGLHLLVLNYMNLPLFEHKIVSTYTTNVIFGFIIFSLLFALRNKIKNQIGFVFIAGSSVKFLIFFALFYEPYMVDGKFTEIEFFTLFIPYITTLTIEIFSLSIWLNKLD